MNTTLKAIYGIPLLSFILMTGNCFAEDDRADIKFSDVFVDAMRESIEEIGCADDQVAQMVRSSDHGVRNMGYACIALKQERKIKNKMEAARNDSQKQANTCSVKNST